jgi:hypothetical protein
MPVRVWLSFCITHLYAADLWLQQSVLVPTSPRNATICFRIFIYIIGGGVVRRLTPRPIMESIAANGFVRTRIRYGHGGRAVELGTSTSALRDNALADRNRRETTVPKRFQAALSSAFDIRRDWKGNWSGDE